MRVSSVLIGLPLLVCGLVAQADGLTRGSVGVHGAVSAGGDIGNSEAGYGFQGEWRIDDHLGVELALSTFSDEFSDGGFKFTQDLTTIGLSGVYRAPLSASLQAYGLAGVDYNMPSVDTDFAPSGFGPGFVATINADDAFGGHLGGGLSLKLAPNLELFGEYRFTFLTLDGDITTAGYGFQYTTPIQGSYNFGLLKIGVNYLF